MITMRYTFEDSFTAYNFREECSKADLTAGTAEKRGAGPLYKYDVTVFCDGRDANARAALATQLAERVIAESDALNANVDG